MQVTAISAPPRYDWRWRIVGYDGETLEESSERFATIAAALHEGTARLEHLNRSDRVTNSSRH